MDGEEETLLGTFTYDIAEEATQTFPLQVWEVCVGKTPGQKRTFASKSIAGGVLTIPPGAELPSRLRETWLSWRIGLSSPQQGQQKQSKTHIDPAGGAGAQSSPPMPAASCGLAIGTRAACCPKTVSGGESQQAAPWGCPTGSCRVATSLSLSCAAYAAGGASKCCHSPCTAVLPGHSAAQRPLRREGVAGQGPSLSQAGGGREDTSTLSQQQQQHFPQVPFWP